jgi:hypothetical protein
LSFKNLPAPISSGDEKVAPPSTEVEISILDGYVPDPFTMLFAKKEIVGFETDLKLQTMVIIPEKLEVGVMTRDEVPLIPSFKP